MPETKVKNFVFSLLLKKKIKVLVGIFCEVFFVF